MCIILCINVKLILFVLVYFALGCAVGHGRQNGIEVGQSCIIRIPIYVYIYTILYAHYARIVPAYTSFSSP